MTEQHESNDETRQSEHSNPKPGGRNTSKKTNQKCKAAKKISCTIKQPFNWVRGAWIWHCELSPIDRFTFWVAIFTSVLAAVGFMQYVAFTESERAFIVVGNFQSQNGEPSHDKPFMFWMDIKNVGKHLADIESARVVVLEGIRHRELPREPDSGGTHEFIAGPLPPDGRSRVKLAPDIDSATRPDQQIVEGIMAGRVRLYIYGYIRYRTGYFILGTGITGFCFMYRPLAERSEFDYELCPNHQYIYAY